MISIQEPAGGKAQKMRWFPAVALIVLVALQVDGVHGRRKASTKKTVKATGDRPRHRKVTTTSPEFAAAGDCRNGTLDRCSQLTFLPVLAIKSKFRHGLHRIWEGERGDRRPEHGP